MYLGTTNDVNVPRTISAIALHPDPNNDTEWHFFSLNTAEIFVRHYNDAYPSPFSTQVIDGLNYLSTMIPVTADDDNGFSATYSLYPPIYPQPVVKRRGRPKKIKSSKVLNVLIQGAEEQDDYFDVTSMIVLQTNYHQYLNLLILKGQRLRVIRII